MHFRPGFENLSTGSAHFRHYNLNIYGVGVTQAW